VGADDRSSHADTDKQTECDRDDAEHRRAHVVAAALASTSSAWNAASPTTKSLEASRPRARGLPQRS
jgi:hypothetical protein